eukprot:TRINITY_DN1329_c0_g1_i1.p1 TRINITY_DN1329_c0_g1~~TRINITY_DN1329_c0_g1_i1.p1  ORF type:complete len:148 (-),score=74.76 TRINITY_DN1329_c0_g1_i1:127-570(-)
MALRRIQRELQEISDHPNENFSAGPVGDNLFEWSATILGPDNTPYAGGIFNLNITFPVEYPAKPPKVEFTTRIYSPNVTSTGGVCLDILKDNWNPTITIAKVLESTVSLLIDPNPDHSLVPEIASIFVNDRPRFEETARKWTRDYAS